MWPGQAGDAYTLGRVWLLDGVKKNAYISDNVFIYQERNVLYSPRLYYGANLKFGTKMLTPPSKKKFSTPKWLVLCVVILVSIDTTGLVYITVSYRVE